jgi:hypothetical protein
VAGESQIVDAALKGPVLNDLKKDGFVRFEYEKVDSSVLTSGKISFKNLKIKRPILKDKTESAMDLTIKSLDVEVRFDSLHYFSLLCGSISIFPFLVYVC